MKILELLESNIVERGARAAMARRAASQAQSQAAKQANIAKQAQASQASKAPIPSAASTAAQPAPGETPTSADTVTRPDATFDVDTETPQQYYGLGDVKRTLGGGTTAPYRPTPSTRRLPTGTTPTDTGRIHKAPGPSVIDKAKNIAQAGGKLVGGLASVPAAFGRGFETGLDIPKNLKPSIASQIANYVKGSAGNPVFSVDQSGRPTPEYIKFIDSTYNDLASQGLIKPKF